MPAAFEVPLPVDAPLPKVIFGTSALGNLFSEPTHEEKKAVVEQVLKANELPVFDSAGKYGAGLALEELGKCLCELDVPADKVLISNKLGWKRVPLTTPEPTFEPGAWVNLKNDAVQAISYEGILECYEQGNQLLGEYNAQIISVHDPDEYLAAAQDDADLQQRRQDVLGAYRALGELKAAGKVRSIGVGAKDISVIDFISDYIRLDWAMFACSVTPYAHGPVARALLNKLGNQGVQVINSAVFNAGFLIGSDVFDYRKVLRDDEPELFQWRDGFFALCKEFGIKPAEACVQFSFLFPEIVSVALNTTKPSRVHSNVDLVNVKVPNEFWVRMKEAGLISEEVIVPAMRSPSSTMEDLAAGQ